MNRLTLFKPFLHRTNVILPYRRRVSSFTPFYESFLRHADNTAVVDNTGSYSYRTILLSSYLIAKKIQSLHPDCRTNSQRVSFLCNNDATYVSTLLACWITGNTAVPLCSSHPEPMLEYYVENSQSKLVISNQKFSSTMKNIAAKVDASFMTIDHDVYSDSATITHYDSVRKSQFLNWDSSLKDRDALIIYTSGTTGLPKGVVLTHGILHAQVKSVVKSWEITSQDTILHSLPLHHIHGIMIALLCLLSTGGTIVMQQKFDAGDAWRRFMDSGREKPKVNLFFAVPTMYAKLVQGFSASGIDKNVSKNHLKANMRLMSSGSQALPVPTFHQWEEITGHTLVERFGMSEIGMALTNPLHGARVPGCVGTPLPDVEVKIARTNDDTSETCDIVVANDKEIIITPGFEDQEGQLMIRGPNVFKEYWNREKATAESFTEDGWFHTGDTACFASGSFKILGRTSVDIIKSGGYKISALEVESCLLRHPSISECTVFGLPDDVWGERVTALIVFKANNVVGSEELRSWCKQYLPPYCVPSVIKTTEMIPRNVMGKVNKKELRKMFA